LKGLQFKEKIWLWVHFHDHTNCTRQDSGQTNTPREYCYE